jgi:uncharacterized OB-fold protein
MQRKIADVFTWPSDEPQLIGSRCSECGAVTFPAQGRCPRCSRPAMEEQLLPRTGTLVSWTTQGFMPSIDYLDDPSGKSFVPFGVGLVQLDDVVRVEARLTENDPDKLDFGLPVELRILPLYTDAEGAEVMTFAFAPTTAAAATAGEA